MQTIQQWTVEANFTYEKETFRTVFVVHPKAHINTFLFRRDYEREETGCSGCGV